MAWFEDLSAWTYLGFSIPQLKAVGWIAKEHPHAIGEVTPEFFRSLCKLLAKSWVPWGMFMGFHECELCCFTGAAHTYEVHWNEKGVGETRMNISGWSDRELIVPGRECLYITPLSIAHYIDAHTYCPPQEFQAAVMDCPEVGSHAYKLAFLANGGRELMQKFNGLKSTS